MSLTKNRNAVYNYNKTKKSGKLIKQHKSVGVMLDKEKEVKELS